MLSCGVAVIVCFWNMQPYIRASAFALDAVLNISEWTGAWVIFSILTGVVLWGLLQTAEVYPVVLRHDRQMLRLIAAEADQCDKMELREEDDPALTSLKLWYNSFPLLSVRSARRGALLAYAIDSMICIIVFPPVSGGLDRMLFVLITGQWGQINWANVALILVMLFVFEIMVRFILFLGLQTYYFKKAHSVRA